MEEDSLKVEPSLSVPCGADFVIAPAAPVVSSLANVADDAVAQAADDAAAQVTNAAADATTRARISYDPSLSAGTGATDKLGNIRVSPYGSALDRSRVLIHEKVHRFFTPRGPLQAPRANFNMWAYKNSHLLQYTEEAIAESTAQLLTGGSLKEGLLFPFTHGYVDPWRVGLEATSLGGVLAGGAWVVDRTAEEEK